MSTGVQEEKNYILYDDKCDMCKASIGFLAKHDAKKRLKFIALESIEARKELKAVGISFMQKNTVYFIHQQQAYIKSSAVLKALGLVRFPYSLLSIFIIVPKFIRDFVYGIIAKNRKRFISQKS